MRKPEEMGEMVVKETVVEETVRTETKKTRVVRHELEEAKCHEKSKRRATQRKQS